MRSKFFLVLTILVTGCSSSDSADHGPVHFTGDSPAVETVNGVIISQALLDAYVRGHKVNLAEPDARQKALKDLADYVLLAEEAKRAQYDTGAQFQADVEVTRLQAVATATAAQIQKATPLSDEILKAEYDQQVERAGKNTYGFTQMLFADEADALGASGQGAYGAYGAGSSNYGWGNGGSGGVVVGPGYARRTPQYSYYPQPARTVNTLGPLGNAIGRTTRPRRSR